MCGITAKHISRVGQNHLYTVYIRYFWQGNHQLYGHIRCIHTVLSSPTHTGALHVKLHLAGPHPKLGQIHHCTGDVAQTNINK